MIARISSAYSLLLDSKKILIKMLFLMTSAFLIFPTSQVFATTMDIQQPAAKTQEEQQTEQMISRNGIMKVLSEGSYLLLWPLVALAGLAMDNGLVYGSFLNLDAPLWKIRTIVKNLSNFLLGFIFLAGILIYSLSPSRKELFKGISKPGDLIKKTLIAGVLIQLSWFIMMVAVDISTILTYTVGGLPATLLAQSDAQMDSKVVGLSVLADFGQAGASGVSEQNDSLKWYVTLPSATEGGTPKYIAQCKQHQVLNVGGGSDFIALFGRVYPSLGKGDAKIKMEDGYCFFNGTIFSYNEWTTEENFSDKWIALSQILKNPKESKQRYSSMNAQRSSFLASDPAKKSGGAAGCNYFGPVPNIPTLSGENNKEYECIYASHGTTLSMLTEKSTSRTGPFMALYGNMINFAKIDGNALGIKQQFMVLVINLFFLVALLLPLVAIVGVLFRRVVQLRLAIALSPLIVLKEIFGDMIGEWGKDIDLEFLSLGEVIKLLFAPVMIGFALSMSLMFVSILKTTLRPTTEDLTKTPDGIAKGISSLTGMECSNTECSLMGFIKIKFSSEIIDFYWFLISMVGVALTWFLLFAAISYTKFGKSFGGKIKDLGEKVFMTQPLIPLPGKNTSIGLGALTKMPTTIMDGYKKTFDDRSREDLDLFSTDKDTREKALHARWAKDYFSGNVNVYGNKFSSYTPDTHPEKVKMLTALKEQTNSSSYDTNQKKIFLDKFKHIAHTYAETIRIRKGDPEDLTAVENLYKEDQQNADSQSKETS